MAASLNDRKFANLWGRVLTASNPGQNKEHWSLDGVSWQHSRHSFRNGHYAFALNVYDVKCPAKGGNPAWAIMIVNETWWSAASSDPVKMQQWGRVEHGSLKDVLRWFELQAEK